MDLSFSLTFFDRTDAPPPGSSGGGEEVVRSPPCSAISISRSAILEYIANRSPAASLCALSPSSEELKVKNVAINISRMN